MPAVTATITGDDEFTAALEFTGQVTKVNVSISGTFTGTITVQRTFDAGATWLDIEAFTEPAERVGCHAEQATQWRIGSKTGEFAAGSADVRLSY